MNHGITGCCPAAWDEAQQRAETYLYALYGEFDSGQRELLARATQSARARSENAATHPVTLVMQALFALLETTPTFAMTPPIQRVSMVPEKIAFPFHEGLGRLFRTHLLPFAGAN